MYCENCGVENENNSVLCIQCRKHLHPSTQLEVEEKLEKVTPSLLSVEKKSLSEFWLVMSCFILFTPMLDLFFKSSERTLEAYKSKQFEVSGRVVSIKKYSHISKKSYSKGHYIHIKDNESWQPIKLTTSDGYPCDSNLNTKYIDQKVTASYIPSKDGFGGALSSLKTSQEVVCKVEDSYNFNESIIRENKLVVRWMLYLGVFGIFISIYYKLKNK